MATPILGLHAYTGTQDFNFNDVNADYNQIDTLPPTVCTSSTRPGSNLYQGRMIYETDTKAVLMWDNQGTAGWRVIKPGSYTGAGATWQNGNGTNLAIGNGTEGSRSRQVGFDVDVEYEQVRGSTTNVGTTYYQWVLPVAMASYPLGVQGNGHIIVAGVSKAVLPYMVNSNVMVLLLTSDHSRVSNNTGAWAANDGIVFKIRYRAAAAV